MQQTKKQWIEEMKSRHHEAVFDGDKVAFFPGDTVRTIKPCDGSCEFEFCTGWIAEYPDPLKAL
jgi:hypothetical protein